MESLKTRWVCVLGVLLMGGVLSLFAQDKPNPYQGIVGRNAFGLKDPPPPPDNTPPPPVINLAKVVLTGTTSIFGSPRALVEITEQEPGKPATTRKPILREGDRDGAVEVLSIDVEKNLVKIRNGGFETNLSFETPKLATAPPPAPGNPAGFPPPPLTTALNPGFNAPARVGATNSFGRPTGGVSVYGNTASPVPVRPIPPAYGSAGATVNDPGGLRSIPSRSMRADSSAVPPLPQSATRVPTR